MRKAPNAHSKINSVWQSLFILTSQSADSTESLGDLPITNHIFDHFDKLIGFCQAKRFLPKTFRFITDNNDVCMIVFGFDVLAELVEGPIDVLFFTGEKDPTRAGMKSAAVFLQPGRRVGLRIDTHRNQERVFPQTIAEGLLHSFEIPADGRTDTGASGKESIDYYDLVL